MKTPTREDCLVARERLMARMVIDEPTGCWLWQGCRNRGGYGVIAVRRWPHLAHRVMYVAEFGPIPLGLTIDHVYARGCRYRHCINPLHLEPVTHAENMRRGYFATKATCINGHPFDESNTRMAVRGGRTVRECRACVRTRLRQFRALQRQVS